MLTTSKPNHRPIAVVVGLCSHGLATVRGLSKGGISVHALESNANLPGTKTKYAVVHLVSDINSILLIDILTKLKNDISPLLKPVLYLMNDNMVLVIAQYWQLLSKQYIISWSESKDIITNLILKTSLENRCLQVGLNYPKTSILFNKNDSIQLKLIEKFPIIVKPSKPLGQFKAIKIRSAEELKRMQNKYDESYPLLIQEWIEGDDCQLFFCALYLDKGNILSHFTGRKIGSFPPAMGQTTVAEPYNQNSDVYEITKIFFEGLRISGPVSLEVKLDKYNNYWVIEPTLGRTDFWLSLCVENGFNIPYIEYCSVLNIKQEIPKSFGNKLWFDTEKDPMCFVKYATKHKGIIREFNNSIFPYFDLMDISTLLLNQTINMSRVRQKLSRIFINRSNKNTHSSYSTTDYKTKILHKGNSGIPIESQSFINKSSRTSFDQSLEWLEEFRKKFISIKDTFVLLGLENLKINKITAILPIVIVKRGIWPIYIHNVKTLSNYYTSLYSVILQDDKNADEVVYKMGQSIVDACKKIDIIDISPLDKQSTTFNELLRGIKSRGFYTLSYFRFGNWFLEIKNRSFEKYYSQLPSKLRNSYSRKKKILYKQFNVKIVIHKYIENLDKLIDDYLYVYNNSWKPTEPHKDFIRSILFRFAQQNWLRLGLLYVDGKPISAQIWFTRNYTTSIFKLAYHKEYKIFSPGTILTMALMEYVIDTDKVNIVDYLSGDDPYKKDWMNCRRERWGIRAYNNSTFFGLLFSIVSRIKKFIK